MILLVSAVLVIAGAIFWKKTGWPWLFIGSVIMGIGSSIPIPVESAAMTNVFEFILLASLVWTKIHLEKSSWQRKEGLIMNKFNYRSRVLYFGLIAFFSLGFFLLQLYAVMNNETGTGSYVLLILWGLMVAFGLGGIFYTIAKNKKRGGQ